MKLLTFAIVWYLFITLTADELWLNVTTKYNEISGCRSYVNPAYGQYLCHALVKQYIRHIEACQCDSFCHHFGDCCMDKQVTDDSPLNASYSCFPIETDESSYQHTIASCKAAWPQDRTRYLCEGNFNQDTENMDVLAYTVPARSEATGVYYKNIYCAMCNWDHEELTTWVFGYDYYKCDAKGLEMAKFNNWRGIWENKGCVYRIMNFENFPYRPCGLQRSRRYVSKCSDSLSPFAPDCPRYFAPVFDEDEQFYRNIHCYLCNEVSLKPGDFLSCGFSSFEQSISYGVHSLLILLDFKKARLRDLNRQESQVRPPICFVDQVYFKGFTECVQLVCPKGKRIMKVHSSHFVVFGNGTVLLFNGMMFSKHSVEYANGQSRVRVCEPFLERPHPKHCKSVKVRASHFLKFRIGSLVLMNDVSIEPSDILNAEIDNDGRVVSVSLCRSLLKSSHANCSRGLVKIASSSLYALGFVLKAGHVVNQNYNYRGELKNIKACADALFPESNCNVTQIEARDITQFDNETFLVMGVRINASDVLFRQSDDLSNLNSIVICGDLLTTPYTFQLKYGLRGHDGLQGNDGLQDRDGLQGHDELQGHNSTEKYQPRALQNNQQDSVDVTENSPCQLVIIDSDDFSVLDDGSILLLSIGLRLNAGDISRIDYVNGTAQNVSVCLALLEDSNPTDFTPKIVKKDKSNILGWLTFVCLTLSVICLSIQLAVYCVTPSLRNTPGKILMCLSASLATADILFLIGPSFEDDAIGCHVVALLLHYSYLSVFSWTNVLSVAFYKLSRLVRGELPFVKYSIYAWSSAAFIALTTELVNYLHEGQFYGDSICWISYNWALLVSFCLPVAIALLFNIVVFVLTVRSMNNTAREVKRVKGLFRRQRFALYVKLVAILGLTWVLGFVATLSELEFFRYAFVVLSGLQGVYVFVVYICKRDILKLLLASVRGQKGKSDQRKSKNLNVLKMTVLTGSRNGKEKSLSKSKFYVDL